MVFGLTKYQIRSALRANNATFPDQQNKATQNPSLKWIYFLFLGVSEVRIRMAGQETQMVSNVNELLKQIIGYCGKRAQEIYLKNESL